MSTDENDSDEILTQGLFINRGDQKRAALCSQYLRFTQIGQLGALGIRKTFTVSFPNRQMRSDFYMVSAPIAL